MYNLIMRYAGWDEGLNSIELGRLFEYTDPAIRQMFSDGNGPNFFELMKLPTLFAPEVQGVEPQFAQVGRVLTPRLRGNEIEFEIVFERGARPVPMEEVVRLSRHLDISSTGRGLTEFNRSHWAVKDSDLYRVLHTQIQSPTRTPTVFRMPIHPAVDRTSVSVMMPFSGAFDAVYHTIQTVCAGLGLACSRADNVWQTPAIIDDVANLIDSSGVVIFDCSGKNANVFYELGLAHAWGKEVIVITNDMADIPFDLRHIRCIQYSQSNLPILATQLSVKLRELTA